MMFSAFPKTTNTSTFSSSLLSEKPIVDKSVAGASKYLTRKWREKDITTHRDRLDHMRPMIACHIDHPVTINKHKTEQMVEERYTEIERENRLLFEKITQIHLKGMPALQGKASSRKLSTVSEQLDLNRAR
jgi:hypothetical protein